MITEIANANAQAKRTLSTVCKMLDQGAGAEDIDPILKKAICEKFMIPIDEADEIRKLAILSIKKQDKGSENLPDDVIQGKIEKYDCHQTNLVSQKKTLLILFIEKQLGLHFTDENAVAIQTIKDLSKCIVRYRKKDVSEK